MLCGKNISIKKKKIVYRLKKEKIHSSPLLSGYSISYKTGLRGKQNQTETSS